jgi:hypothetical protein
MSKTKQVHVNVHLLCLKQSKHRLMFIIEPKTKKIQVNVQLLRQKQRKFSYYV